MVLHMFKFVLFMNSMCCMLLLNTKFSQAGETCATPCHIFVVDIGANIGIVDS